MRMNQIEILHNFVPNIRKIFFFGKNGFFSVMAAKKADCRVKTVFFGENLVIKGLKTFGGLVCRVMIHGWSIDSRKKKK